MLSSAARPMDATAGTLAKMGAIFVRDARCALAYPAYFHSQWVSIAIEVTIAYYLSTIVPPSAAFGATAMPAAISPIW